MVYRGYLLHLDSLLLQADRAISEQGYRRSRKKLIAVLRWDRVTWGRHRDDIEAKIKAPRHEKIQHLSDAEFREALRESHNIPLRPELWLALQALYYGWHTLGRDMNGSTLYQERLAWLDRNWPEDEREAGECLLAVLEGEAAEIYHELHPLPKGSK